MTHPSPIKTNVALRLYVIFSKVEKTPNLPMIDIWHQIFIRKEEDHIKKWMEAAKIATKIYDEITILEQSLQKIVPEEDYSSEIQGMKAVTSVQYLGHPYVSLKGNLPDGFLRVLKGYSREIGYSENQILEHQLDSIQKSLDELKNNLASLLTDDILIAVAKKYILMIESAIIDYEIMGSRAFSEAYRQVMLVTIENEAILRENKGAPAIQKIGNLFDRLKEAIDAAHQGSEILRIGQEILEKITG